MPFSPIPAFKPAVPPIALGAVGTVLTGLGLTAATPPAFGIIPNSPGNTGQVTGKFLSVTLFTAASSLWTPNAATNQLIVEILGDGGGGAGATWTSAGSAGGGGGAGGYASVYFRLPAAFTNSATVVIGQGGAGGAAGAAGSNGTGSTFTWTDDSFGADLVGNAGHGGVLSVDGKPINAGGQGGTGSAAPGGATVNTVLFVARGGYGFPGLVIGTWGIGGAGGSPPGEFSGSPGSANWVATQTHVAGAGLGSGYGSGGAGSVNLDSQTSAGAAGRPGVCRIWEWN